MKNLILKDFSVLICVVLGSSQVSADRAAGTDKLLPCPNSPNCVSSLSDNDKHFIKPFDYKDSIENARQKLIDILENSRGVRLVKTKSNYLHAEFRSVIFRFVDDVEFYFPEKQPLIHVKSASRSGYYDFGVNRRRIEHLRAAFNETVK